MIIVQIPKQNYGFLRNIIKKLRRLEKNKYYRLEYDVYFSDKYALILLKEDAYHLAFALSVKLKCENHNIECPIVRTVPIPQDFIHPKIWEAAQAWALHRLPAKYLKLREVNPRSRRAISVPEVKIHSSAEGKNVIETPYHLITIRGNTIQVRARREKLDELKLD